jgi:hypothetical protein
MPAALLGSSLAPLLVWSGLLVGPPSSSPTEPALPPEVQAPAPVPEPEVAPAPAPEPEPEPAPVETLPVTPPPVVAPASAPGFTGQARERYVRVRPPAWRGTGQFVAGGVLYAAAIAFQAGDSVVCGDCAAGFIERLFLFGGMGLMAGGGVMRGHADAYDDTALRRKRPDTRRTLILGAALTGAGAVLGLVNEGLWWRCVFTGDGPYERPEPDDFWGGGVECRYELSRGLLDVAAASTTAGLGLLSWSLTYRRDAKAYERARVIGLRPTLGRDRLGLGVGGRF